MRRVYRTHKDRPACGAQADLNTGFWQDVLGIPSVGPDQNYFDLGGDSPLAVRLFARIEKVFRVRLPLATLFEAPTIQELAEILRRQAPESGWSSLVAIQPKGSRPPFFCVHPHGGNVLVYRELSRHLGADQPFYGLQVLIALAAGTRPLWRNGWPIGSMILRY